jgi:hypothetical protein
MNNTKKKPGAFKFFIENIKNSIDNVTKNFEKVTASQMKNV